MSSIPLRINGNDHLVDVDPTTPLLWVLRDHLGLTGTKYGCGVAQCGACTVHLNGQATRSCVLPVQGVAGTEITTIEGLSAAAANGGEQALQKLWIEMNVPQCGYCQSGMLMAAASLLRRTKKPTDADIDAQVSNICRCGTYPRVRAAIHRAAESMKA
jgi:isoquinoline 1-oxidoreductase alpha subunit